MIGGPGKAIAVLASVRVAIALIALLALLSLLATLVPQRLDASFYRTAYPRFLGSLILAAGFDRFFASPLFLAVLGAFLLNLGACTVRQILSGVKKPTVRKLGTVTLHFALILLAVGSFVSATTRRQASVFLVPGEYVTLPAGRRLALLGFTYEKYPDGRPKAWTSLVRIDEADGARGPERKLGVNKPLRVGTFSIYQASWQERPTAGGIVLASGLEAVEDRGYPIVLAALLLTALGLGVSSITRLAEARR